MQPFDLVIRARHGGDRADSFKQTWHPRSTVAAYRRRLDRQEGNRTRAQAACPVCVD